MLELPDHVIVGPIKLEVRENDGLVDEQVHGQIIRTTSIIELSPRLSPGMRRVTLWHEIWHQVFDQYGIEQDEDLIKKLSYATPQILDDNPRLTK